MRILATNLVTDEKYNEPLNTESILDIFDSVRNLYKHGFHIVHIEISPGNTLVFDGKYIKGHITK